MGVVGGDDGFAFAGEVEQVRGALDAGTFGECGQKGCVEAVDDDAGRIGVTREAGCDGCGERGGADDADWVEDHGGGLEVEARAARRGRC